MLFTPVALLGIALNGLGWIQLGSRADSSADAQPSDNASMTRLRDTLRRFVGPAPPACSHLDQAREVDPRTDGCEECLATGGTWVELRHCLACGHVGCCDLSPNRHARAHFVETGHAIIRANVPGHTWTWCWVDEVKV